MAFTKLQIGTSYNQILPLCHCLFSYPFKYSFALIIFGKYSLRIIEL